MIIIANLTDAARGKHVSWYDRCVRRGRLEGWDERRLRVREEGSGEVVEVDPQTADFVGERSDK